MALFLSTVRESVQYCLFLETRCPVPLSFAQGDLEMDTMPLTMRIFEQRHHAIVEEFDLKLSAIYFPCALLQSSVWVISCHLPFPIASVSPIIHSETQSKAGESFPLQLTDIHL